MHRNVRDSTEFRHDVVATTRKLYHCQVAASALCRGRRARRTAPRARHRTVPVTFAEIKEVDEETEEPEAASTGCAEERRRRPDLLDERLGRQFAEFRRRRAPRDVIREPPEESAGCDPAPAPKCGPSDRNDQSIVSE